MKATNLLVGVMLALAIATLSPTYGENSTEKDLASAEPILNPLTDCYSSTFDPFTFSLTKEGYTLYLLIPVGINVQDIYMELAPADKDKKPSNVKISLGDQDLPVPEGDFSGAKLRDELKDAVMQYMQTHQPSEYKTKVPLLFSCETEGRISVPLFSVTFCIEAVSDLGMVPDPETGVPRCFFWKSGAGFSPQYELQIREKDFSSDSTSFFRKTAITSALYTLDTNDITTLTGNLIPGKTHYWGVKVMYQIGGKPCWSQWTVSQFTMKPEPVKSLNVVGDTEKEIQFTWENPKNIDFCTVEVNGHEYIKECRDPSCSVEKTNDFLYSCGLNTLTVYAVSDEVKSEPAKVDFTVSIERLNTPEKEKMFPNSTRSVREKTFPFEWEAVPGAGGYQVQLLDSMGAVKSLPTEAGMKDVVTVSQALYNPWDERKYGEYARLDLKSGEIYTWQVRAIPLLNDPRKESEWAVQMFVYQPVLLRMLVLFAGIGGLMGGFIRVATEERKRAAEKKRRMRVYLDMQTSIDLLVGVVIGVVFYLLINQTLSQELNPLNIPPFSYVGGTLLGFVGGIISYDLTRLRRAFPAE